MKNRRAAHAYFEDEQGSPVKNENLHLNWFKESGRPLNYETKWSNPLDPTKRKQVQPQDVPGEKQGQSFVYQSYVGMATWERIQEAMARGNTPPELKITLLWGAGNQNGGDIDASGLRYFLEKVEDRMLIEIPGEESPRINIGITGLFDPTRGIYVNQVASFLRASELKDVPYRITTLAAYSTGYGGLNQSVNEDLLPLKDVEAIVYFDCLYRADRPPLPAGVAPPRLSATEQNSGPDEYDPGHAGSAYNTRRAIDKVLAANSKAKVVAYAATPGGSPRYLQGGSHYVVDVPLLIDLRSAAAGSAVTPTEALFALSITRCLDFAEKEGLVSSSEVPATFKSLRAGLLPRGEIASSQETLKAKPGFLPQTTLLDWGNLYAAKVKAAQRDVIAAVKLISDHELIWPGGYPSPSNPGGVLHAAVLSEFGWEYLV